MEMYIIWILFERNSENQCKQDSNRKVIKLNSADMTSNTLASCVMAAILETKTSLNYDTYVQF